MSRRAAAHRRELQGGADVAAAGVGEPRQSGARERGRELRAVCRGRADRERRRDLDVGHGGLRRGLFLGASRPRDRAHQWHRPAQGAHHPLHDRLDRVHHVRDRRPQARNVTIRRAVWRWTHTLLHWKNSSNKSDQGARMSAAKPVREYQESRIEDEPILGAVLVLPSGAIQPLTLWERVLVRLRLTSAKALEARYFNLANS